MTAFGHLWREHRIALLAFVAALVLAVFFGLRLIVFTIYWSDPAHLNQHPEGWMTLGYIARSWDVPREELRAALGLAAEDGRPRALAEIARSRGMPLPDLIAEVEAALRALRARAE